MSPSNELTINTPDVDYSQLTGTQLTLSDRVLIECKRLATISKGIQEKILAAKTKPKKDYFGKKLKKNNNVLADMLVRLDQLQQMDNKEK